MSLSVSKYMAPLVASIAFMMGLVLAPQAFSAEGDRLPAAKSASPTSTRTTMIFGISWHPGYCQTRPRSRDCQSLAKDGISNRQFSLHGLWTVKKSYCGVAAPLKATDKARKWLDLPKLVLGEDLARELAAAMPGTRSGLDRHEWIMHGTCSGDLAADYYRRSLDFLAAVNASAVGRLFAAKIGQNVTEAEVKSAFDQAFGAGTGDKIKMRCRKQGGEMVITGLTIGLGAPDPDDASASSDLGTLIAAAGKTKFGCAEGQVAGASPS